ncbi:DUF1254 domain-containing protein [Ruegeria sediminis]|uniref:DUF1254 domain-containing protein n=1 Tax=Ruegeria sediminis TaxID=2583820 RepID=A0ABY2X3Y7_9RHOB|nr:DUF1254 domain-containing protein [Ruegeria sediminis]TMV10096.1 DUF1254 domain-containing protein [Ruegeria sediminis]
MRPRATLLATVVIVSLAGASHGQETIDTRIGSLEFTHDFENGYPTLETQAKLFDEMDFQRATQAYIWAIPIVSFAKWQQQHEDVFDAQSGDIVLYRDTIDKYGLLTANTTTPYALSFINMSETGPVVIDMPEAEVRGAMHTMWQIGITQMTEPGRYVFYPPGTEAPTVENAQVFQSDTNSIFFGIRLLADEEAQQVTDLQGISIYPLSEMGQEHSTKVINVDNRPWQGWQPRGFEYFEIMADILLREPVAERDRFFMAMLKPLGIEIGEPFAPDQRQKQIMTEAALVGEAMAKANDFFNPRLEQSHYADGSMWELATSSPLDQRWEHYDALDGRAAWFYEAVTNDAAMQSDRPGWGQIYLATYRDADGDWLDGANNYVLNVPPDVPAEEFWSLTVYDVSTRAPIVNDQVVADKSSRMDLDVNGDGSVTLYIGPDQPAAGATNWIPTVPGKAWFPYWRFYSPTEAYFDRSWVLPDIEKAN